MVKCKREIDLLVPHDIRSRYRGIESDLLILAEKVRDVIFNYCRNLGYAYVDRIKSVESLSEKIETGRFSSWSNLDDMFACAIIIPNLSLEQHVLEFLLSKFLTVNVRRRGSTRKKPEEFRFDATRYIGKLNSDLLGLGNELMLELKFEIQIRSAFEHAWQETSHSIYKGSSATWKTHRLVAQLKAAVEQLDSLVESFEMASTSIVEHEWPEVATKRQIVASFAGYAANGLIPEVVLPKDWTRFSSNLYKLILSSKGVNVHNVASKVEACMNCVQGELGRGSDAVPLSLSLLQFVFGVISRDKAILPPFGDYVPFVTENLMLFYPDVKKFVPIFSLDD